ncbi:MAG: hypothetical protein R8K47_08325 [Mariprofundaceae bacterium]
MSAMLYWRDVLAGGVRIPDGEASGGHHVRIVMPRELQDAFVERVFLPSPAEIDSDEPAAQGRIWVESGGERFAAGSEGFFRVVGSLLRGRGLLANLTLRENLLLPFLYDTDHERLEHAAARLAGVADWLGVTARLEVQAGEATPFLHALASLGRCMLAGVGVIIAQEAHVGMAPEFQARFRDLTLEAVRRLDAGVLYLTSSLEVESGITFARTLTVPARGATVAAEAGR